MTTLLMSNRSDINQLEHSLKYEFCDGGGVVLVLLQTYLFCYKAVTILKQENKVRDADKIAPGNIEIAGHIFQRKRKTSPVQL